MNSDPVPGRTPARLPAVLRALGGGEAATPGHLSVRTASPTHSPTADAASTGKIIVSLECSIFIMKFPFIKYFLLVCLNNAIISNKTLSVSQLFPAPKFTTLRGGACQLQFIAT